MSRITVAIADADPREREILSRFIRQDEALVYYTDRTIPGGKDGKQNAAGPDVILRGSLADKISRLKLAMRRREIQNTEGPGQERFYERDILEIFREIGIPANVRGYVYLKDAILLSMQSSDLLSAITKKLYPVIAGRHGTTTFRVERAIRHAIETAWERGDLQNAEELCGLVCPGKRGRPTNTEFISSMAERLRVLYGLPADGWREEKKPEKEAG